MDVVTPVVYYLEIRVNVGPMKLLLYRLPFDAILYARAADFEPRVAVIAPDDGFYNVQTSCWKS